MVTLLRTNSAHADFIGLVKLLDAELAIRDGAEHAFYAQYNTIDAIRHVVVVHEDGRPVGCGALKPYDGKTAEIKRMYVPPHGRRKGIASRVLHELEAWARELSFEKCVLETGKKQPEAIALYRKSGYAVIPNYGQYAGVKNSICFEKKLR